MSEEAELVIDDSNFDQYFKDVRKTRPERGEIIARYSATAEFSEGHMKKDIIDLLFNKEKAYAATQVMRKLGCATEGDSLKVCRQIAKDLALGMSPEDVEKKSYKYTLEMFYYTKKEYVPLDDPHWNVISITNLEEFLDAADQRLKIRSKVIKEENNGEDAG